MPDAEPTPIDQQMDKLTKDFAEGVAALSTNPMLRAGLMKTAIVDVIWELYHAMPDERHALADGLEGMADAVSRTGSEDRRTPE